MITAQRGMACLMASSAASPSVCGIRTSINTMSGDSSMARSMATAPVFGLADDGDIGFGAQHGYEAFTDDGLVIDD